MYKTQLQMYAKLVVWGEKCKLIFRRPFAAVPIKYERSASRNLPWPPFLVYVNPPFSRHFPNRPSFLGRTSKTRTFSLAARL